MAHLEDFRGLHQFEVRKNIHRIPQIIPLSLLEEIYDAWTPAARILLDNVLKADGPKFQFDLWAPRLAKFPLESQRTWEIWDRVAGWINLGPRATTEAYDALPRQPLAGSILLKLGVTLEPSRVGSTPGYHNFIIAWLNDRKLSDDFSLHELNIEALDKTAQVAILSSAQKAGCDICEIWQTLAPDLLLSADSDIRSKLLWLVVGARKLTTRVPAAALETMKHTARVWLVEADSRSRNDVIGMLRNLFNKLRASTYRADNPQPELEFVQWILAKITGSWMLPNSPYRCLIFAVQMLEMIVESGIDPALPKKNQRWAFNVTLYDQDVISKLVMLAANEYWDVRKVAARLLAKAPSQQATLASGLRDRALDLLSGSRGREADGGSRLAVVAYDLLNATERDVFIAQLARAASQSGDVQGYFAALAAIFETHKDGVSIQTLLETAEAAWSSSREMLTSGAPEGSLPTIEDEDDFSLDAQTALSQAWRAAKESAHLIEIIVPFLNTDQLREIGESTVFQLTAIRHRGAFSAMYPTFLAVCKQCSMNPELCGLSMKWLRAELAEVYGNERLVTRRSAGLPMLVTAVLRAQPHLVDEIVAELLEDASKQILSDTDGLMLPQVHASNCLRAVTTDAQLVPYAAPFLDRILEAAVLECSSSTWVVRNAGIMLVAAVHSRMFPRRRAHCRQSAQHFFARFKNLLAAFTDHLRVSHGLETVFPVLSVLMELHVEDGWEGLRELEPLLMTLLASKEWKIRELSARALASIAFDSGALAAELCSRMTLSAQNQLHGIALALSELGYAAEFEPKFLDERNKCFETRLALARISHPCLLSPSLSPNSSNPSWVEYEALRISVCNDCLPSSTSFNDGSAAIWLRNFSKASPADAAEILHRSKRPDIQILCLQLSEQPPYEFARKEHALSVREAALGIIARLAPSSDLEHLEILIDEFANEDIAPESSRCAAANAIAVFGVKSDCLLWSLLRLLSDDEDSVRCAAVNAASCLVPESVDPNMSCRAIESLIAHCISPEYLTAQLELMVDFRAVQTAMESRRQLFVVEKVNMYRDDADFIHLLDSHKPLCTEQQERYSSLRNSLVEATKSDLNTSWYVWSQLCIVNSLLAID